MRHLTCFFIALLFSLNIALSQSNFSEAFSYFPRNIHIYVPSAACIDNNLQSNFAYKTYIGKLSIIRTYYADINMNISRHRSHNGIRHIAGFGFYNDREGDFFSKIRGLVRYAMHIPLKEDVFLSVGTAFHLVNYKFSASSAGASGSDMDWTGSVSSSFHGPSYKLAVSFNDFNNPKIRPISYDFSIYRYVTLFGEKTLDLNTNTQVKGSGRCNLVFGNKSTYLAQIGLVLSRMVGINGFYYVDRGWGLAFDINSIKIQKSYLDFSLAYQIPKLRASIAANQYELNLRYYITNK